MVRIQLKLKLDLSYNWFHRQKRIREHEKQSENMLLCSSVNFTNARHLKGVVSQRNTQPKWKRKAHTSYNDEKRRGRGQVRI